MQDEDGREIVHERERTYYGLLSVQAFTHPKIRRRTGIDIRRIDTAYKLVQLVSGALDSDVSVSQIRQWVDDASVLVVGRAEAQGGTEVYVEYFAAALEILVRAVHKPVPGLESGQVRGCQQKV
jgi:hypothetical protein